METLADIALGNSEPDDTDKVNVKGAVLKLAKKLGLCDEQANALAIEACKGDRWLTRKFVKFCRDYCPLATLSEPDDLFMVLDHMKPPESDFDAALGRIYKARSTNLHIASPFPRSIRVGTDPMINFRDLPLDMSTPPIAWFERVVSIAARNFLVGEGPRPFLP